MYLTYDGKQIGSFQGSGAEMKILPIEYNLICRKKLTIIH